MKGQATSTKGILKKYMKHVSRNGKRPKSIEKFCSKNNILENDFYLHFKTFKALENFFWKQLMKATEKALAHEKFESKTHEILSFYFTLFENMNLNRGFIYFLDKHTKSKVCFTKQLKKVIKPHLKKLCSGSLPLLDKLPIDFSSTIQSEVLFVQFISIYQFWNNDKSEDQEQTDAFIEKSVKLVHDLSHAIPTESIFDYGKFLFKHAKQFV
jgi:hypothetical protein